MAKRRKFTSEFKTELVLEVLSGASSQAELCRRHNLNEDQLSKWKQQFLEKAPSLFDSTDKQSSEVSEKRIAHLEQLVGRMAVALDIQKKLLTWLGVTLSEKRCFISALQQEHSVRDICEILGVNRSSFYYHPPRGSVRRGFTIGNRETCRTVSEIWV